jgi:prepilin-type N-terminal cleavage/methylation domain-containing protein
MPLARSAASFVRRRGSKGFTLLEVCVVLFIVAVVFVVAAVPATHLFNEEKLLAPVRELQNFAKTARLHAMSERQTYVIRFRGDGYELLPGNPAERHAASQRYFLPANVKLLARTPADDDFHPATDMRWYFAPNGLCEPIAFLLQQGKSWVRFHVDPLTARIQDQQSFVE